MKPAFAGKAVGLALAVLALNLLATTGAVLLYARFVEPGRTGAYYTSTAPHIAEWSAPLGGALLFFGFTAWLGRRRPARNGFAFAIAAWVAYVVLDVGSGVVTGGLGSLLSLQMAASMLAALLGGLAGAAFARARSQETLA